MKWFMRVTNDKYELPMCPPMRASELAEMYGIKREYIWKSAEKNRFRRYLRAGTAMSFVCVILDDD